MGRVRVVAAIGVAVIYRLYLSSYLSGDAGFVLGDGEEVDEGE